MSWSVAASAAGLLALLVLAYGIAFRWPLDAARARTQTAACFAYAVELRVPSLAGKSEATARLAVGAADRAGLGAVRAERLRLAARLADIGYAAVPYATPGTKEPTSAQSAVLARHAAIGAAMLELVPGVGDVADLVRRHHDRDPLIPLEHRLLVAATATVERLQDDAPAPDALLAAVQSPDLARAVVETGREPVAL